VQQFQPLIKKFSAQMRTDLAVVYVLPPEWLELIRKIKIAEAALPAVAENKPDANTE
jgi:hypothetical protein